ncbi:MAG: hypothetical protein JRF58_11340 [Deltaproteobacteria bacterium]|nr:hypothetical protein [Deltaproteobacteria bacterium]
MKGFSAPKNAGKALAHAEQGPREKNFRYLKAGILPSMASAREVLNAGQANVGSRAAAPGVAVKAAGAKVADFADSRPKER